MKKFAIKKPKANHNLMNAVAYSLLPLLLVILVTIVSIPAMQPYMDTKLTVDLTDEYVQFIKNNQIQVVTDFGTELENTIANLLVLTKLIANYTQQTLAENTSATSDSYYYGDLTPTPEYSEKYNASVDFSRTSYMVYPQTAPANRSAVMNQSIAVTANLDVLLPAFYNYYANIYSIQVAVSSGIIRTYPFYRYQTSDYRVSEWYNNSKLSTDVQISTPWIDSQLEKVMLSVYVGIYDPTFEAAVVIHFALDALQQLVHTASSTSHTFLTDKDGHIVAHTLLPIVTSGWNTSYYANTSLNVIEDSNANFTQILAAQTTNYTQYTLNINNVTSILTTQKLQYAGLFFGVIQTLSVQTVTGAYSLMSLLAIPLSAFVIISLLMALIFRRYGFLKGLTLEDVLEKANIPLSVDEAGEMITDKVKEQGIKLRATISEKASLDNIVDKVVNIDEVIIEKVDEKLDAVLDPLQNLEEKLDSFQQKINKIAAATIEKVQNIPVDINKLIRGDYSDIANLNKSEILSSVLLNAKSSESSGSPEIDALLVAKLLNIDSATLEMWVNTLPPEVGVSIESGIIKVNPQQLKQSVEKLMTLYEQVDFEQMQEIATLLSQLDLTSIDPDAIQQGDFSSLSSLTDKREVLAALLMNAESLPLAKVADATGVNAELLQKYVEKIPANYGISLSALNQEDGEGNLPQISVDLEQVKKQLPFILASFSFISAMKH